MIRILLADDHGLVVAGLRELTAATGDIEVVGTAADGRRALELAQSDLAWDVLVLDLSLPRVGGFEVLRQVREKRPAARVVVLTMYPEDQYAVPLLNLGAAAFVSKASPPEDLLEAIRAAHAGEMWSSAAVKRRFAMNHEADKDLPHKSLTSREYQVFALFIEGQKVSDIAAQLDLTVSTVSNHLAAIRTKLSARTLVEVVRYAYQVGLID
jgi:DNA-binding NarL/FixJ family response regulator